MVAKGGTTRHMSPQAPPPCSVENRCYVTQLAEYGPNHADSRTLRAGGPALK